MTEPNRLELSDPSSLRAMAHPARVVALTHLMHIGDATATELGEHAGLSASAMSYHLRILERAGLVETAPSRGDGRERVWHATHAGINMDNDVEHSPEMQQASAQFLNAFLLAQDVAARQYLSIAESDPELYNRSQFVEGVLSLTTDEMEQLGRAVQALMDPYVNRRRVDKPVGAREFSFSYRLFPRVTAPTSGNNAERRDPEPA